MTQQEIKLYTKLLENLSDVILCIITRFELDEWGTLFANGLYEISSSFWELDYRRRDHVHIKTIMRRFKTVMQELRTAISHNDSDCLSLLVATMSVGLDKLITVVLEKEKRQK
jgi:hypothetical protein